MGDNGASPEDQSGAKECHGDNASKFQRSLQRRRSQEDNDTSLPRRRPRGADFHVSDRNILVVA